MRLYLNISDVKLTNDPDTAEVDPGNAPDPGADLATGIKHLTVIAPSGDLVSWQRTDGCSSY
jgi:hypothetical protein